jgi:gamma-glutamylaminecyclotransferase
MSEKQIVFVYGTLKRGFGNHHLLNGSKFIGQALTKEKYALYVSGIPFVIESEPVSQISGEVYEVDQKTLARLDRLEGHPDWYCRKMVYVSGNTNESGESLKAWIYFFPKRRGVIVESGIF